ncbi:MAG: DUF1989 domain-containing protein [Methanosarcinaceae archaeon]|nr:DUF1989 domain-containing protein [Methanosarcinaceae archaeon]
MIINFAESQTISLRANQKLKITTSGQQACTITFLNFSAALTRDNNMSLRLYEGDGIYGRNNETYFIIESMNTGSMIDISLPGCRAETLGRDGCRELLSSALEVTVDLLPDTINLFFDVNILDNGMIQIDGNKSESGDFIVLQCLKDVKIGMSACPDSRYGEEGRITLQIF